MAAIFFCAGQSAPAFDAASVKAVPDSDGWPPRAGYWVPAQMVNPQRFRAKTLLAQIIRWAYGVKDFQISGGPAWIRQGRFEILATTERPRTQDEMRQMLQALLAERFRLKVHREIRELPVYALRVGKSGPKMENTKDPSRFRRGNFDVGNGTLRAVGGRMDELCDILTDNLERPVIDKTGLTGRYDFNVSFDPPSTGPNWAPFGAAIFTPIQALGLRIVPEKDPVDMIVVDSVERFSEN